MALKYRTDIDGLRAVAVLVVLFFHTNVPGFTGGFVGVDIFFVISGFLITKIVHHDILAERFSFLLFYERRIRRIFPALIIIVLFALIIGSYFFYDKEFRDLGQSITASILFFSNFLFWRETGYFDRASFYKPLLHTWSLSVEEQFYIFFPLTFFYVFKYFNSRYKQFILLAFLVSLGASIWGVHNKQAATFYLLPTRAWELLAGSILALGIIPRLSKSWLLNIFSVIGIGLIVYSVGFYTESMLFPGYNAILPVLGSVLIIYSSGEKKSIIGKTLSIQPLLFTGLISYSLYLWHWPILAFAKYLFVRPLTGLENTGIILISIFMSIISWKYVETPFRKKTTLLHYSKRVFISVGLLILIFAGIGFTIQLQNGMPWRIDRNYPELVAVIKRATNDKKWLEYGEWERISEKIGQGAIPKVVGREGKIPSFALIGDSHARSLIPSIEINAKQFGVSGFIITRSSTPFLIGVHISNVQADNGFDEVSYNKEILKFLSRHPNIQTIFLASRWGAYINGSWVEKGEDISRFNLYVTEGDLRENKSNKYFLSLGLKNTVDSLVKMKRKVILISDVPEVGWDAPALFYVRSRLSNFSFLEKISGPSFAEYNMRQGVANAILEQYSKKQSVIMIRPEKLMFDEKLKSKLVINGKLLYRDDDHLSSDGAYYIAPVFNKVFKEIVAVKNY